MQNSMSNSDYDDIDHKIARIMAEDASLTSAVLGELVGLSTSAVNERVRKLKQNGKIKKIAAFVNSEFMGMQTCAFIFVSIDSPENNKKFIDSILGHKNVMECHYITGEYSYLIKVRIPSVRSLESFISSFLQSQICVTKILTQICMHSIKEESVIVD